MNTQLSSLVTCCPACSATFYVTPEQLSVLHGKVRCGKCGQAFNALDGLSELSEAPVAAAPVAADNIAEAFTEQSDDGPEEIDAIHSEQSAIIVDIDASQAVSSIPVDEIDPPSSAPIEASPKITWDLASKNKLKRRRRPKSHIAILSVFVLVLAVLAIAQTGYYMRTQIASHWPVTKPYLVKACALIGCSVELPKQIALIAIDDSDLQEDAEHQGLIHLSSTIINNAAFIQAYPLLEVTLTDNYDKPILRRSFTPAEYLPKNAPINQGMGPHDEVRITIDLSASGEPVAGYRVFVTYP